MVEIIKNVANFKNIILVGIENSIQKYIVVFGANARERADMLNVL